MLSYILVILCFIIFATCVKGAIKTNDIKYLAVAGLFALVCVIYLK